MIKPIVEILDNDITSVGRLRKLLKSIPDYYTMNPFGADCSLAVDHKDKRVYIDETSWIEEYKEENPGTIEVDEEDYKSPTMYVVIVHELLDNGAYDSTLYGVFSTMELAEECGEEIVSGMTNAFYEIEQPLLNEFGYK